MSLRSQATMVPINAADLTEATIQGINDAYLVIVGIGVIGLLLSFFIKRVKQAVEEPSNAGIKHAVLKKA